MEEENDAYYAQTPGPGEWVLIRWQDDAGVRIRDKRFVLPPAPAPGQTPAQWEELQGSVEMMNQLLDQTGAELFPEPTLQPAPPSVPTESFFDYSRLIMLTPKEGGAENLVDELAALDGVRDVHWLEGPATTFLVEIEWTQEGTLPPDLAAFATEKELAVTPLVAYRNWGGYRVEMEQEGTRLFLLRFGVMPLPEEQLDLWELLKTQPGIEQVFRPGSPGSMQAVVLVQADWDPLALFGQLPDPYYPQEIFELAGKESASLPDLSQFFSAQVEQAEQRFIGPANEIRWILTAYLAPLPVPPPSGIPNYFLPPQNKQPYLTSIAARAVWAAFASSRDCGDDVTVALVDYNWDANHVDLAGAQVILPAASSSNPTTGGISASALQDHRDHGLGALGVLLARHEASEATEIGMRGIVPAARVRLYAAHPQYLPHVSVGAAIRRATQEVGRGDVILVEQQTRVPQNGDTFDLVPVEHYLDAFQAIYTATRCWKKLIVVEPAANGGKELLRQGSNPTGVPFHDSVVRACYPQRDSGAIIVGAGSRPRHRLAESNWGEFVHVQANGEEVGTLGYGDLRNSPSNERYHDGRAFRSTSSASSIVAGAAAAVQSLRKSKSLPFLLPGDMRSRLIATGDAQPEPGNTGQHVGPRPNLARALAGL